MVFRAGPFTVEKRINSALVWNRITVRNASASELLQGTSGFKYLVGLYIHRRQ